MGRSSAYQHYLGRGQDAISGARLFEAVAVEAEAQIRNFKPQNLSNVAWAFATLGIPAPRLFEAVAAESEVQIRNFKPQDLSNMTWAFATLNKIGRAHV